MRLIIGISGASGAVLAVELLGSLKTLGVETHLVVTAGATLTLQNEMNLSPAELKADHLYDINQLDAPIASGTFHTDGMIVIPCSMKTLAGIASGFSNNLLLRAADVSIKENRQLLLLPREMPFSRIHLRNMKELADCGVIIMPPVLTFFNKPSDLAAQINHIVNKILRLYHLPNDLKEWAT